MLRMTMSSYFSEKVLVFFAQNKPENSDISSEQDGLKRNNWDFKKPPTQYRKAYFK